MSSGTTESDYDQLDDFEGTTVTNAGLTYDVYRSGAGPAVIVMPEIPGITPKVAEFARAVRDRGLTVYIPSLFGTPGKPPSVPYLAKSFTRACIAKEFTSFATNKESPVTAFLTALARDAHVACGGPGVGAVGMCYTGGFALAMATEPSVIAPVVSQPSLPIGLLPSRKRATGLSEAEAAVLVERTKTEGLCALGMRFSHDTLSPPERFAALRELLGDSFLAVELDSSKGNPDNNRRAAHSVVTEDLQDDPNHPTQQTLTQVLDFLTERLLPAQ